MGFPDSVLADDEQPLLHRHPHVKCLVGPVLVLLLATACAAFAAGFLNARPWDPTAKNVVFAVIWAVWLVVIGWLTLWPFVRWATTHFVLTDRRGMFRAGLLKRSGVDIALDQISHVQFVRGLRERMLRTGTLIVSPVSAEPLEFYDIPRVQQVHALICEEVFGPFTDSDDSDGVGNVRD